MKSGKREELKKRLFKKIDDSDRSDEPLATEVKESTVVRLISGSRLFLFFFLIALVLSAPILMRAAYHHHHRHHFEPVDRTTMTRDFFERARLTRWGAPPWEREGFSPQIARAVAILRYSRALSDEDYVLELLRDDEIADLAIDVALAHY